MMKEFKAEEWIRMKGGRGWVATVVVPTHESLPAVGSTVSIDGFRYEIGSVECVWDGTSALKRHELVGIIVRSPPLHKYLKIN